MRTASSQGRFSRVSARLLTLVGVVAWAAAASGQVTTYTSQSAFQAALPAGSATNAFEIITTSATVGAFALPSGSKDAVLLISLAPGNYTALISGANDTTGIALVEVYEVP